MEALTPSVPSLVQCKKLTVKGAIKFESGVVCQGEVTLVNEKDDVVEVRGRTFADTKVPV